MDAGLGPRYADCPTAEVAVEVAATPDRLWPLVTDIGLPARFSTEFQGATWLDDGPRPGARFVGRNHHPALGSWETTCTVVDLAEPELFGWAVGDPAAPTALWRFALEPVGEGRTRLRQWVRIGPGRSGLNLAIDRMPEKETRIVAGRLREFEQQMQRTCEGIRAHAEAG